MTSVEHLVCRFQTKEGGDTVVGKAKENKPPGNRSASPGQDDMALTAATPAGDKLRQKPALPGCKPTRLPSGVALRKQKGSDRKDPDQHDTQPVRQTSVSFTTEDLDLFQRRSQYVEIPASTGKPNIKRLSRKVSAEGSDSNSVKRRSRSVGAPGFRGLKPLPSGNKPTLPTKPKVKNKPTNARKSSSGLPRPFQVQHSADTSTDDTPEELPKQPARPVSGNRNKSYKHAVRPVSGSRRPRYAAENSKNITSLTGPVRPMNSTTANSSPREPVGLQPSSSSKSQPPTTVSPIKYPRPFAKPSMGSSIPVPNTTNVPPSVSVKPTTVPLKSPVGSPNTMRALRNLPIGSECSDDDPKTMAKANILSVLAKRSGVPTKPPLTDNVLKLAAFKCVENTNKEGISLTVEGVTTSESTDGEQRSIVVEGVTTTESSDDVPIDTTGLCKEENVSVALDNEVTSTAKSEQMTSTAQQHQPNVNRLNQELNIFASAVKSGDGNKTGAGPVQRAKTPAMRPCSPPPPIPKLEKVNNKTPGTLTEKKPIKCSPSVSPKPHLKTGKQVLEGKSTTPNLTSNTFSDQVGVPTAGSPLPEEKHPAVTAFSTQLQGSPSDSNDADDEEDLGNVNTQKPHFYVKSFSLEQKDIKGSSTDVKASQDGRPSSHKILPLSGESDSSTGDPQMDKANGKKGVIHKLMKLTSGLEFAKEVVSSEQRQVEGTTFYMEKEEVPGTTSEGENHHILGKTTFYSSDSGDNKATVQRAHPQKETTANGNAKTSAIEVGHKVLLRHSAGGRKVSNKSFRSGIFVENILEPSGVQGSTYENIVMCTGGMHARNSSSTESVEDKSECSMSGGLETLIGTQNQIELMEGIGEEVDSTRVVESTEDNGDRIYENVTFKEPSNNNVYTEYKDRGLWRRQCIKRCPAENKKRDNSGALEDKEGGNEELEYSYSDDSFDSYSDDSVEEKVDDLHQDVQQSEVPPEEPKVPKTAKLKLIATELLTTEDAYVKRLHLIDQLFHFKIVIENRVHHMFPDDVIPQMFSNVKSIYQFHKDFLLPQLKKRMEDWDNTPKVGDLMRKFAPFLKLYSEYVTNFDHAINTINTWTQRSPKFAGIIQELQKKPECGMLTLQHHMLEPIQRVPRYEMLLKDYLKHLHEDSVDVPDTKKALELVTMAAAHANETMWKIEKFRKLLELNEMFGGMVDLIDPSRELVKEGKIFKISAGKGLLYERYLFLFTDMLMLCTNNRIGLTRSYRINNLLQLNGMQVQEGDNMDIPLTFYVKSKTKTIELHSNTPDELNDWYTSINNVICDYNRRQKSRLTSIRAITNNDKLGVCAPTWVKDQNTSMCMLCGTAFSMIRRRHHCRCCGIVVCARCSSRKAPLAYQDNKPDRVCDICYKTLCGRTVDPEHQESSTRVKGVLQVKGMDPSVVSGMMQFSTDKRIWERRWYTLQDNFVLYTFKAPKDVHAMTSLPLPGYVATEVKDDPQIDREQVVKLSHAGTKDVYYFHIESNYTKWLVALQCAIKLELPPDYVVPKKTKTKD